jgi:hypothetical protein
MLSSRKDKKDKKKGKINERNKKKSKYNKHKKKTASSESSSFSSSVSYEKYKRSKTPKKRHASPQKKKEYYPKKLSENPRTNKFDTKVCYFIRLISIFLSRTNIITKVYMTIPMFFLLIQFIYSSIFLLFSKSLASDSEYPSDIYTTNTNGPSWNSPQSFDKDSYYEKRSTSSNSFPPPSSFSNNSQRFVGYRNNYPTSSNPSLLQNSLSTLLSSHNFSSNVTNNNSDLMIDQNLNFPVNYATSNYRQNNNDNRSDLSSQSFSNNKSTERTTEKFLPSLSTTTASKNTAQDFEKEKAERNPDKIDSPLSLEKSSYSSSQSTNYPSSKLSSAPSLSISVVESNMKNSDLHEDLSSINSSPSIPHGSHSSCGSKRISDGSTSSLSSFYKDDTRSSIESNINSFENSTHTPTSSSLPSSASALFDSSQ